MTSSFGAGLLPKERTPNHYVTAERSEVVVLESDGQKGLRPRTPAKLFSLASFAVILNRLETLPSFREYASESELFLCAVDR